MTETQREPVPRDDTSELATALAFLRFARRSVLKKTEGLEEEQLRRAMVPSGTSLLGLVAHLTEGERYWFGYHVHGDPAAADTDFATEVPPERLVADVLGEYRRAAQHSDEILTGLDTLEALVQQPVDGEHLTVRWVVAHMTSETARHAGHADILREQLDGVTGR